MDEVTLFPAWKQAMVDFMATQPKPGDLLSVKWLNTAFDLSDPVTAKEQREHQIAWMTQFNPFRDALLEKHKVCLKALYNGSYEVVSPEDQTDHAESFHVKAVHRELNHMIRKMTHVDVSKLTDEQVKKNTDSLARAAMLKSAVRGRRTIGMSPPPKRLSGSNS